MKSRVPGEGDAGEVMACGDQPLLQQVAQDRDVDGARILRGVETFQERGGSFGFPCDRFGRHTVPLPRGFGLAAGRFGRVGLARKRS